MQSVKQFFTKDAWKTVKAIRILTIKQEGYNYFCTICELEINDDQDESINCSLCSHFKCTGLKSMQSEKVLVLSSLPLPHYNFIDLNKATVRHGYPCRSYINNYL